MQIEPPSRAPSTCDNRKPTVPPRLHRSDMPIPAETATVQMNTLNSTMSVEFSTPAFPYVYEKAHFDDTPTDQAR